MKNLNKALLAIGVMFVTLPGCSIIPGIASSTQDAELVQGPPIRDIVTPFDNALLCLKGRVKPSITFSVGAILDQTGKEQLTEGGAGKFVTQGAGDIVQSALYAAGLQVLNRRDPRILETEVKWGLQNPKDIIPSNYFITGSINSLDFIPGGGIDLQIGGVGPKYRQQRILIGLDLSMTDSKTGRIVANVPMQKQIYASELGLGIGRFIKSELVTLDGGWKERETLHFALRQMLNLGTFELLTQLMKPENYAACRDEISALHGFLDNTPSAKALKKYQEEKIAKTAAPRTQVPQDEVSMRSPVEPQSQATENDRKGEKTPANMAESTVEGSTDPKNGGSEISKDTSTERSEEKVRQIVITQ